MTEQLRNIILRLVAGRFTGSIEIHFKDGVAHRVHKQEYIALTKPSDTALATQKTQG